MVLVLSAVVACGDDAPADGGGGAGPGGADPGGADPGGADPGGSDAGGGGSTTEPASCGAERSAADLEGGTWDDRFTISGLSGHDGIAPAIHDFAVDMDGSVVAAGRFQWFEGAPAAPLMRFRNGAWEPARTTWEIEAPLDGFSAVAIAPDGDLALATNDSFGERDGEIWIDDGTGLRSIGAFSGQVRSLAWFEGRLWVAGLFLLDGAVPAEGLATWDGTAWSTPPGGALAGAAFELLVSDDTLYVGGSFTDVGGIPAANVASYDGAAWTALDFSDSLTVYALARTDAGDLYAGGAYGDFAVASGVAKWTGTAWQTVGGGLGQYQTRGVVTDLVAHGEVVDATGCFNTAGGLQGAPGAVASQSVARWTGETWASLDEGTAGTIAPWFQPMVCGDEGLTAIWDVPSQRLAYDGERLFAGGFFAGIDGVLSQALAVHDGSAWSAQGTSGLGIGGSIDLIASGGESCDVYGLGQFTHAAGQPADGRVVHWNGTGWTVLTDPLPSDAYCPALDVSVDGRVAVGCMAFPPKGDARGAILVREGDAMIELPVEGLGPVMGVEWSPDGETLWIVGAGVTGFLARLDGEVLTVVEDGFEGSVNALDVVDESDIVVAGAFTKIGSTDASRIARWDGASWSPLADGAPGQVLALERDASTVFISTYDEGNGAYLLGAFDGTSWRELASPEANLTPQTYFSFNRLRAIDGGLIAVGTGDLDDGSGRGALLFRDGVFSALGGGVGAMGVGGVAVTDDSVWIGGTLAESGSGDTRVSSVGVARYVLAP